MPLEDARAKPKLLLLLLLFILLQLGFHPVAVASTYVYTQYLGQLNIPNN
jgi:hypothetical protein